MLLTVAALIALFGPGVGQLSRCQQHHQYPAFDRHRDGDRHRRLYLAVGRRFRFVGRLDRLVGQRAGDFAFVWHGFGTTGAIVVTLLLCTLVGLFNALLIVVFRILICWRRWPACS